jgi:RNA polymerase sigma-70 factor (ECF subfamily)
VAVLSAEEFTTAWVEAYGDAIVRFLTGYVGDPGEAQDLAQEVFSRVFRQRSDRPRETLTVAWLYTVARRLAIDHHRSRQARLRDAMTRPQDEGVYELTDTAGRNVDVPGIGMEDRLAVRDLLERLPTPERLALILFYFQDWPIDAVARELNVSPAAVRVRLHRARDHFKRLWEEDTRREGHGRSGR